MTLFQIYARYLQGLLRVKPNLSQLKLFLSVRRHTLVSPERLENVYRLTEKVIADKISGDLVECGVWRGGCVAVMSTVLKKHQSQRKVLMYDSFEGLPEPTKEDGSQAENYSGNRSKGKLSSIDKCVATLEVVQELYNKLNLPWENVVVQKGWFQDTLPKSSKKIGKIAVLRLDGDWYESTKICLDYLYPHVSQGGYVILDDYYHWEGCRKALDEFISKHKLSVELIPIDEDAVYFRKQ